MNSVSEIVRRLSRIAKDSPLVALISFFFALFGFFISVFGLLPFDSLMKRLAPERYLEEIAHPKPIGSMTIGSRIVVDLPARWPEYLKKHVSDETTCALVSPKPKFVAQFEDDACKISFHAINDVIYSPEYIPDVRSKHPVSLTIQICVWGQKRDCVNKDFSFTFYNHVDWEAFQVITNPSILILGERGSAIGELHGKPLPDTFYCSIDTDSGYSNFVLLSRLGSCEFEVLRVEPGEDVTLVYMRDVFDREVARDRLTLDH